MGISKLVAFIREDLWRIRVRNLPWPRALLVKVCRILVTAVRHFASNRNQLRASALTYYSLVAIVPVLAALFGVARGFGIDELMRARLSEQFKEHGEVFAAATEFANRLLEQTSGGVIAGVGIVVLLWSVVKVLGHVEGAFNTIWNVKVRRPWSRRVIDAVAMLVIVPALFAVASAVNVYVMQSKAVEALPFLLRLAPYLVSWLLFTLVYMVIPHTRVPLRAALSGGILAGTAYQLWQWFYIEFQVGVTTYGAIYGSFAALPLFLVWLHVSWMILLSGAEISYASQHVAAWEYLPDVGHISLRDRRQLSLYILHYVYSLFAVRGEETSAVAMSDELEIPISAVRPLLSELLDSGLLVETISARYVPGRPVATLTLQEAVQALESNGGSSIPVQQSDALEAIRAWMDETEREAADRSPSFAKLPSIAASG